MKIGTTNPEPFPLLSSRECAIIAYFADGYTPAQIADKTGLTTRSVLQQLYIMKQQQGLRHVYELISWAYLKGFLI
ncbi:helix-turn-helix transcriptional regulator [Pontibacter sp. E15-1]|uniref:helix-turn-helix transcriptional regulator n=1 Tax=Pontibacter sp. E15-1 TaxID=2919918 RepID=UPI00397C6673